MNKKTSLQITVSTLICLLTFACHHDRPAVPSDSGTTRLIKEEWDSIVQSNGYVIINWHYTYDAQGRQMQSALYLYQKTNTQETRDTQYVQYTYGAGTVTMTSSNHAPFIYRLSADSLVLGLVGGPDLYTYNADRQCTRQCLSSSDTTNYETFTYSGGNPILDTTYSSGTLQSWSDWTYSAIADKRDYGMRYWGRSAADLPLQEVKTLNSGQTFTYLYTYTIDAQDRLVSMNTGDWYYQRFWYW